MYGVAGLSTLGQTAAWLGPIPSLIILMGIAILIGTSLLHNTTPTKKLYDVEVRVDGDLIGIIPIEAYSFQEAKQRVSDTCKVDLKCRVGGY